RSPLRVWELTHRLRLEAFRHEEVRGEPLRRAGPPAQMREEDERVEEHAVAELLHPREELARADLLVKEAQGAARFAGCVASRGLHAALFGQHADATGGLRLDE